MGAVNSVIPPGELYNPSDTPEERFRKLKCHATTDLLGDNLEFQQSLVVIINPLTRLRYCYTFDELWQTFTYGGIQYNLSDENKLVFKLPQGVYLDETFAKFVFKQKCNTIVLCFPVQCELSSHDGELVTVFSVFPIPREVAFLENERYMFSPISFVDGTAHTVFQPRLPPPPEHGGGQHNEGRNQHNEGRNQHNGGGQREEPTTNDMVGAVFDW